MPALDDSLKQKLALLQSRHQRRHVRETAPLQGAQVRRGGKTLISFSGNDYFGLSRHPAVIEAATAALAQFGAGAGASRLITGSHPLYAGLERELATFKETEAACVFGSGYLANLGTISALVGKSDLILADRLAHACMLDAARLSGATMYRFAHNSIEHCRALLQENRADFHHCLILTETVFSMDGDRAPVGKLAALAKEFDAWLMTDDAHGLGLPLNESAKADIQLGTLSKGVGGYGGYVCGSQALVEYLHNAARSFVFSTGLPPATIAAAAAALRVMREEPSRCARPLELAALFCKKSGLPAPSSAIVPLVIGESEKALEASAKLEAEGFLVSAIRPPTVPEGTARLRIAFSSDHHEPDVERLASVVFREGWGQPA